MIKRLLPFLSIFILSMYINTNASEPNFVETSAISVTNTSRQVKSIKCKAHEWEYCTRTSGSIAYYNYRCIYCGTYRYSPWKK
jgi:hypothetical protein